MRAAIREAEKAAAKGEVPVGAVVVREGKIVARAYNRRETTRRAAAHAEMLAIEKANRRLGSWRLDGCEMYVTLEPCAMCAGAIANARVDKVYFGAYEKKGGCAESLYPVLSESGLNHRTEHEGGILGEACSDLLTGFFRARRG